MSEKTTKERIIHAVATAPPEKVGYVLRMVSERGSSVSFKDLLTDLEPFIDAEIKLAVQVELDLWRAERGL